MVKGMVGYVVLIWVGINIIDLPTNIQMLLADGVVVLSAFWLGLALVDVLIGTTSHIVGLVVRKKEEVESRDPSQAV